VRRHSGQAGGPRSKKRFYDLRTGKKEANLAGGESGREANNKRKKNEKSQTPARGLGSFAILDG